MKWLRFQNWPLRLKILAVLYVAAMLPLPVTAYIGYRIMRDDQFARTKKALPILAEEIRIRLDNLHNYYLNQIAGALARHPEIIQFATTSAAERKSLEKGVHSILWMTDNNLLGVGFLDAAGVAVVGTGEFAAGKSSLSERSLRDARQGIPTISDLYFADREADFQPTATEGKSNLDPYRPTVAYIQPVQAKDGRVLGFIVVGVKAEVIWRSLRAYNDLASSGSYASLLDRNGVRIGHSLHDELLFFAGGDLDPQVAHTMIAERRFGKWTSAFLVEKVYPLPKQFELARADSAPKTEVESVNVETQKQSYLLVGRRLKSVPWTIFYIAPENKLKAAVAEITQQVGLGAGIIALLALVGGMLCAGRILKPINSLSRAIRALGGGDLSTRLATRGNDEIDRLAAGFNWMAERLESTVNSLNEREARIQAIVDTAADGILTIDENGTVESFNFEVVRITRYTPPEIIGRNLSVLIPTPEGDWDAKAIARVVGVADTVTMVSRREVEGRRRDGSRFPMELALGEIQGTNPRRFTATVHDLTRRKQVEEDLLRARNAAEAANQIKSQFLASMSHELRTPLNAIIGYTEMLQEEAQDGGQDQFLPDLDKVHSAGKHLLLLINDILDLARIEAGKIELFLETIALPATIEDVATTVLPLMAKNANRFQVQCADNLGTMVADLTRVRQCLFNLLGNAAKFTKQGTISLRVVRENRGGEDQIVFSVQDTGIGMSSAQLKKLFQVFSQVNASTTREYGGTGLGLAISRKLSQMMGGDISVESTVGQGSTFTLVLPATVKALPEAAPESPPTPAIPQRSDSRPTVLVIDDDPAARDMLTRLVSKEGFQVAVAANGEEGLRLARELRPNVITLDVVMPGMDGWGILSALKADPALADIPVILVTIVDDPNLGRTLGAVDHLTKPVERSKLVGLIKQHCNSGNPCRAVVVEDDAATREMLRRQLEKDGWTVMEAANGREALVRIAQHQPALVLLDLLMPEMNGFEFIDEFRRHEEWNSIPVVVVTAKDLSTEDRRLLGDSLRLSGPVKRVFEKGKYTREELLREVHNLATQLGTFRQPASSCYTSHGTMDTSLK